MMTAPELSSAERATVERFGLNQPSDHVKTVEDVIDWECVWGECKHEDGCSMREQEVCVACSEIDPEQEFISYMSWEQAERRNHSSLAGHIEGGTR